MLVRESSDWPPTPGGAQEPGCESPKLEGKILSGVYPENGKLVTFSCEGQDSHWHLTAHSAELAEKITEAFHQNVRKAVTELAALKLN